jgi:hypothetical protein
MDGNAKPGVAGDVEGTGKIGNPAEPFFSSHSESGDQRVRPAGGEPGRGLHLLRSQMPHADNDHPALDAGRGPGGHAIAQTVEIGCRRQSGGRGMIGRNEDFRIDCVLAAIPSR